MSTYGSGKYTGVIMKRSVGVNVAADVRGATKVSMEDVLSWDPQVIFVQDRYAPVAEEICKGAAWQNVDAVENHRAYVTPEHVKPWRYPLRVSCMHFCRTRSMDAIHIKRKRSLQALRLRQRFRSRSPQGSSASPRPRRECDQIASALR